VICATRGSEARPEEYGEGHKSMETYGMPIGLLITDSCSQTSHAHGLLLLNGMPTKAAMETHGVGTGLGFSP